MEALSSLSRSLDSYFYYVTDLNVTIAEAEEVDSETVIPDVILFQWTLDEIFDDVKMLSANLGKHAVSEKAGDQFDIIAIVEEDRDLFMRFAKSGALYVYTKIQGLAKLIEPGFLFNEGITIQPWEDDGSYLKNTYVLRNDTIYKALIDSLESDPEIDTINWEEMPDYMDTTDKITYLITNSETYDTNVIRVWSEDIKDILVLYALEKMYKFRGINSDALAVILDEKGLKERELVGIINSRRIPVRRFISPI
jgi:hypothetical protein